MPILKVVLTDYWFDKIESGEKKHEFRKATPFWGARISKVVESFQTDPWQIKKDALIEFQKAYRKNPEKMTFKIKRMKEWPSGLETDLKCDESVYDIELGERIK